MSQSRCHFPKGRFAVLDEARIRPKMAYFIFGELIQGILEIPGPASCKYQLLHAGKKK